jgi:hypothetical protein
MIGFFARLISKDIAKYERKRAYRIKQKVEKESQDTIKLNEEIHNNQKEQQKEMFLKDIEQRNKDWEAKLVRRENELKDIIAERDADISKLKAEKIEQSAKHESDIAKIKKDLEEKDAERIKELFLLKDEMELEFEKGRKYRINWEEKSQFVKSLLFEIMGRIENNQFLSEEIIKRVNSLISSKLEFQTIMQKVIKHQEKTSRDSIFYIEEHHIAIPEVKNYEIKAP